MCLILTLKNSKNTQSISSFKSTSNWSTQHGGGSQQEESSEAILESMKLSQSLGGDPPLSVQWVVERLVLLGWIRVCPPLHHGFNDLSLHDRALNTSSPKCNCCCAAPRPFWWKNKDEEQSCEECLGNPEIFLDCIMMLHFLCLLVCLCSK